MAALSFCWVAFAFYNLKEWKLGKDYAIQFSSNDVGGVFKKMTGKVVFDTTDLAHASFNFTIETASINTGNETQNKHVQNGDWLDVKKYPTATFESVNFSKSNSGYIVNGNFTLHGTTKEIAIPFTFNEKGKKSEIQAKFEFNRVDYGVGSATDGVDPNLKIEVKLPVLRD